MLSYDELYREYERLKKENTVLKAKLAGLTDFCSEPILETSSVDEHIAVNKYSPSQEKIELFKSLFAGRTDVFAKRWYSKTSGKSGYQPVCENEWNDELCDKRKYKCADCPNRKLMPLTDEAIYHHLAGKDSYARDVIGVYPLLPNDTCMFCCVDFDDEGFEEAARAYYAVCVDNAIPAYIERSRSGKGAHIWIFFFSPMEAKTARAFVSAILTSAMDKCSKVDFKSYDRCFPNQDTMPKGGFGNLIALPLQGLARKQKNSVFVDEHFSRYYDQWAFLSSVKRVDLPQIETVLAKLSRKSELGSLMSDSEEAPWRDKEKTVSFCDFPEKLQITISNMIYIPVEELSNRAINVIKRLAAFKNPDFYRAQAMRMPIYNKPRVICLAENLDKYMAIPRGCRNALEILLLRANISYQYVDETNIGNKIDVAFNGELREEQKPAADALLSDNIGVLSATTAFGKTVVAAYLISQKKTNTLVLVHTQSLMKQWQDSLEKFLRFDTEPPKQTGRGRKSVWSPIGVLGGGKNTLHGFVDVAVMQSLFDGDDVKELVRNYGMVIVDECHHVSAVNFEAILKYVNAKYVYGLTATPTRQDGHHPIIFMQCGEIKYRVDAKEQAGKRSFEHYLIPKFTSFRKQYDDGTLISKIYSDLAESDIRNKRIAEDVIKAVLNGRTPIVLTERKEHIALLKPFLQTKCKNVITLTGAASQKEKRISMEALGKVPASEPLVILATGKYVGEGFDYPRLDTLFLALPIAWKGKVAQYAGRLHRDYDGKNEVEIYDYADIHIPVLERMYQKRLKGYSSIGYKVKIENDIGEKSGIIYDGNSFFHVFEEDIQNASGEIVIVSPFVRMSRIKRMERLLKEAIAKCGKITVVTRPSDDFLGENKTSSNECIDYLQGMGVTVIPKSNIHQKFTVIDSKIVWYGSVNFLSYGTAEESIMRFESNDIACELLDTVL